MSTWQPDDHLDGFERTRLGEKERGEGFATLVRHVASPAARPAILWIHGYADYFYQGSVGRYFAEAGFAFYALDLRGYGRSLAAAPLPNFSQDLREYWSDIADAVARLSEEGHVDVVLAGHSTGGLILTDWLGTRPLIGPTVRGLLLNSPFLASPLPLPSLPGRPLERVLGLVGRSRPLAVIPRSPSGEYGRALHSLTGGEWDYDLDLKPHASFPIRAGWLRAVLEAQERVRRQQMFDDFPVLGFAAVRRDESQPSSWDNGGDVVLSVEPMMGAVAKLARSVRLEYVAGAIHDVFSSRTEVRETASDIALAWMRDLVPE